MLLRKFIAVAAFCLGVLGLNAQSYDEFKVIYEQAKLSLDSSNYDRAILLFDDASLKAEENPFMPYARFYKAYCFDMLNKPKDARYVLGTILTDAPSWPKSDFVYYYMAELSYKLKDYAKAKEYVEEIKSSDLERKRLNMLYHFVAEETNLDKLAAVQLLYKKDDNLAAICAYKVNGDTSMKAQFFLEYLVQEYDLGIEAFELEKNGEKKDHYNVAILIPFNCSKKNSFKGTLFLDMYTGMKMAFDSLRSLGYSIDYQVYDTEKSVAKVREIISHPDFVDYDLILGPVFSATNEVVADFAEENNIVMFNLLNRRGDAIQDKEFVFSSLATYETIGRQLAHNALLTFDTSKVVRIYYDYSSNNNDSTIAANYKVTLEELGLEVEVFKAVTGEEESRENYEQSLKWTKEATVGQVAVFAKKNTLMASTLISVWETGDKEIPVLAPKEWLNIRLISYEQFYRRNIHFYYPEYVDRSSKNVIDFQSKYKEEMHIKPLKLQAAAIGFDLVFYCGKMLNEYGTFFHTEQIDNYQPHLLQGLNYTDGNANALVPIVLFDEELNFVVPTQE